MAAPRASRIEDRDSGISNQNSSSNYAKDAVKTGNILRPALKNNCFQLKANEHIDWVISWKWARVFGCSVFQLESRFRVQLPLSYFPVGATCFSRIWQLNCKVLRINSTRSWSRSRSRSGSGSRTCNCCSVFGYSTQAHKSARKLRVAPVWFSQICQVSHFLVFPGVYVNSNCVECPNCLGDGQEICRLEGDPTSSCFIIDFTHLTQKPLKIESGV